MTSAQSNDEQEALEACRQGRIDGLRCLYERFSPQVHRTCVRLLGDAAAAEDATQEIFLRVFKSAGSFDGRARFSTWLYRLAVNHTVDILRRQGRRRELPLDADVSVLHLASPEPSDEQQLLDTEQRQRVLRLVYSLPGDARTILVLREMEELTYREISQVLDVPLGTVMSRLSRARAELKARWEQAEARPMTTETPLDDAS